MVQNQARLAQPGPSKDCGWRDERVVQVETPATSARKLLSPLSISEVIADEVVKPELLSSPGKSLPAHLPLT